MPRESEIQNLSDDDIQNCIRVLERLQQDPSHLAQLSPETRVTLLKTAGQLSRPHKLESQIRNREISAANRKAIVAKDRQARASTGIREARRATVFSAPIQIASAEKTASASELSSPRNCYVCKAEFKTLHFFYDSMCPECATFNYQKRFQTASLKGQVAVITGARLKIGYQATLMMLKAGARVIATTRFPHDAALRFAREPDFAEWGDRLHVYGLDLRHIPSVEIFTHFLESKIERLDLLINNAAQTVRRPPGFYAHLMEVEKLNTGDLPREARLLLGDFETCKTQLNHLSSRADAHAKALPVTWHGHTAGVGLRASAQLSQIPYSFDGSIQAAEVFPEGKLDADLQQVDLRQTNSWRLRIGEVPTPELLEVQLVNSIAPFVLCNRLTPLMQKDNTGCKHIVNVTAMEGKFYRFKKEDRHPHTNMAKAALNMLTHTSAGGLEKHGIYMNAVDTGWVTDEDPAHLSQHKQRVHDFEPPLDIVDGAARVCDPFFDGINTGKHWVGKFLKDYRPIDW